MHSTFGAQLQIRYTSTKMAMGMAQSSDKHLLQGQTIAKSGMKEDNPPPSLSARMSLSFFLSDHRKKINGLNHLLAFFKKCLGSCNLGWESETR